MARAGGEWCGVQSTINAEVSLLLFNSPTTGSTLAIPFNPLNFDTVVLEKRVALRITESDKTFARKKINVMASDLERIADTLSELAAEINKTYLRRDECQNP